MVLPFLNCFGIRRCRYSVRLRLSFHTNLNSVLVWKMEYVLIFFLFPITYYYFLLPTTKQLFWSFGPFLVHWMLMDDMYVCSRALPVQIAYEGWGCSNQTWLKVIEIEMEKAIRSRSSQTRPQDQYRFVSNGTFLVLSRRGQCRSVFTLHPTAFLPSPFLKN